MGRGPRKSDPKRWYWRADRSGPDGRECVWKVARRKRFTPMREEWERVLGRLPEGWPRDVFAPQGLLTSWSA